MLPLWNKIGIVWHLHSSKSRWEDSFSLWGEMTEIEICRSGNNLIWCLNPSKALGISKSEVLFEFADQVLGHSCKVTLPQTVLVAGAVVSCLLSPAGCNYANEALGDTTGCMAGLGITQGLPRRAVLGQLCSPWWQRQERPRCPLLAVVLSVWYRTAVSDPAAWDCPSLCLCTAAVSVKSMHRDGEEADKQNPHKSLHGPGLSLLASPGSWMAAPRHLPSCYLQRDAALCQGTALSCLAQHYPQYTCCVMRH